MSRLFAEGVFYAVPIQKKLKVDINTLKAISREGDVEGLSAYLDRETGEVLSATDMLSEEIQNRKRFLKIPSQKIWSISKEQAKNWVEETLQAFAQTYDETFLDKAKARLTQTFKDNNFSELIYDTIIELDEEVLDDNFFESWLGFVEKQERRNVKIWLALKGIDLDE